MEEGELPAEYQPPNRQDSTPPRRYAPYTRPGMRPPPAASSSAEKYHWYTLCSVRNNMMASYDALYDLSQDLRARGDVVNERKVASVLNGMADTLSCGSCGKIIPRLDNSAFVARCGHVYHKMPENCWARAGNACNLPSCRRARRAESPPLGGLQGRRPPVIDS